MPIAQDLQNQHQTSPLIELYTLDCSNLGGSVYRFTPMFAESGSVSFQGQQYFSIPIQTEGWEVTSSGTQPRPTLQVSNTHGAVLNAVITLGDIVGAKVTRLRTYEKYLDGMPEADANMHLRPDVLQVEQKTSHTNTHIAWQLSTILERLGTKLPRRQILKDQTARHLYAPGISRYRGV